MLGNGRRDRERPAAERRQQAERGTDRDAATARVKARVRSASPDRVRFRGGASCRGAPFWWWPPPVALFGRAVRGLHDQMRRRRQAVGNVIGETRKPGRTAVVHVHADGADRRNMIAPAMERRLAGTRIGQLAKRVDAEVDVAATTAVEQIARRRTIAPQRKRAGCRDRRAGETSRHRPGAAQRAARTAGTGDASAPDRRRCAPSRRCRRRRRAGRASRRGAGRRARDGTRRSDREGREIPWDALRA